MSVWAALTPNQSYRDDVVPLGLKNHDVHTLRANPTFAPDLLSGFDVHAHLHAAETVLHGSM